MKRSNCSREESLRKLAAKNKALMEQVAENASLAAENTFLKRQLDAENAALKKKTLLNVALVEENMVLKKKLDAAITVIKEHVAEKAILENLAAENAGLAADRHAVKKQLTATNATLRKQIASTAFQLHQAREDMFKIEKSEEELEKKLKELKTTLKVKEEENFSLSADLQLEDLDKVIVENEWKAKFEDLQENYEKKLRCSVRKQEASFKQIQDLMNQIREAEEKMSAEQEDSVEKERKMDEELNLLIQQNIELQRLALKTNEYREKVKKEKKEKKKQEKKEQQEREKKDKEERNKPKKREKEEGRCFHVLFLNDGARPNVHSHLNSTSTTSSS